MISITERVILMAFVRDWYAVTSNSYTGKAREQLLDMSRSAGVVVDELYGAYGARTEDDGADD